MAQLEAPLDAPLDGDDTEIFKVKQILSLMPPFYKTKPGGVLYAVLLAYGNVDNDLGGIVGG